MKYQVEGNTEGVRDAMLARLDSLYGYELGQDDFLPRELMKLLAECSCRLNREIAVYITRDGEIVHVAIGTDCDVELTDYRLRRNTRRLSRVRCVHTHPDGDGRLSDVDLSALKIFRYDAMTAIGVRNEEPTFVQTAFLGEGEELILPEPVRWYRLPEKAWLDQIVFSDGLVGREDTREVRSDKERAVLMGIESMDSLEELRRLAETAGAEVAGVFLQKRDRPDGALCIGKGRAEELARDCQALGADVCIFDEELTGVQVRNHAADGPREGGFPRAGRADHPEEAAVRNGQADFLQGRRLLVFVGKGNVLNRNHLALSHASCKPGKRDPPYRFSTFFSGRYSSCTITLPMAAVPSTIGT